MKKQNAHAPIDVTTDHPVLTDAIVALYLAGCYQQMTLEEMARIVASDVPELADLDLADLFGAVRRRCRERQIRIHKPKPRRDPVTV